VKLKTIAAKYQQKRRFIKTLKQHDIPCPGHERWVARYWEMFRELYAKETGRGLIPAHEIDEMIERYADERT
jgi:hypothetical protein